LLNLAGAMDFPTSGKVSLDGVDTAKLHDAELARIRREKVGFIFQSFQLLPTLSAVENVELPLLLAGGSRARERALNCLHWVEMDGLARRMPYQLSGGQMQRVAIARALTASPRLLLADEPTGNLDDATGEAILNLLRRIVDEKKTALLMATHSAEAARMADEVVHLRDGRLEARSRNRDTACVL
jgi:putative ABC transport system ATP-binding protein